MNNCDTILNLWMTQLLMQRGTMISRLIERTLRTRIIGLIVLYKVQRCSAKATTENVYH